MLKRSMNWTGVAVTYGTGPTTVIVDGVVDVEIDPTAQLIPFIGDAGLFAQMIAARGNSRSLKIVGGNVAALQSIPFGTDCTVVATLNHPINGIGSGAITFQLVNAVLQGIPIKGQVNQYAMATVTFMAFSSDGVTDPLTSVVTP